VVSQVIPEVVTAGVVARGKQAVFAFEFEARHDAGREGILYTDSPRASETAAGDYQVAAGIDNVIPNTIGIEEVADQPDCVSLGDSTKVDLKVRVSTRGCVVVDGQIVHIGHIELDSGHRFCIDCAVMKSVGADKLAHRGIE